MSPPLSDPSPRRDLGSLLAEAARRCPGLGELLLVDGEGVLVARAVGPAGGGADPEELGVESTGVAAGLRRAARAAGLGQVREWAAVGEGGALVVVRIPGVELYVVGRARQGEFLGRVRLALELAAERIAEQL
ncbi:MAG: hypothetical protein Kow0062_24030 [Acidobacteriota bacterium]|nr:MAG: hypothetical protein D6738_00175 [Acidobacteriota bacterium]